MRPWGLRFNSSSRIVMAPLSNFDRGRGCGACVVWVAACGRIRHRIVHAGHTSQINKKQG